MMTLHMFRPFIASILLAVSLFAQSPVEDGRASAEVGAFLIDFHAAEAEGAARDYLGHFREDAVIFGTAPGERYDLGVFRSRVQRAFSGGRGRKSEILSRNITVDEGGTTAWFDELVRREAGIELRITGVLRRGEDGWKIVLLDKVIPVPNELALELAAKIKKAVPRPKRSIPEGSPVAQALVDFHRASAEADLDGYFELIAPDAVLFGTAADERHTREGLRAMLAPYFATGRGLETELLVLNLTESEDGRFAWFDARLYRPSLCELRGSGLLRRETDRWRIVQYNWGFPVPNDLIEFAIGGKGAFTRPLSVAALRNDFALLCETLEEWHPALHVYETKEEIDHLFETTKAAIIEPMTALEFETLITPVIARVHCVHTRILPTSAHHAARRHTSSYLPVEPQVIGGRLFVRTSYVDVPELVPGSEILEIDGLAAEVVIVNLTSLVSTDGEIESHRLATLNDGFNLSYATHLGSPAKFELRVRERGSEEIRELTVPALDFESWNRGVLARGPEPRPGPGQELETRVLPEEDVAILTYRSFQGSDTKSITGALETFFAGIHASGIANLIVDLRLNPGGDPSQGATLVSYLADEPFVYFRFDPEKNSWRDALALRGFTSPRAPAEHHFRGRIFVLIGGRNTSTAGHVISLLKQQGRVILIGQDSGSTWTCNDNSKDLVLPASGIRVHIARTTYQAAVTGLTPGVGIRPDHLIEATVEAMLEGRDLELSFALELAGG
jgi:ketosteroid isomerase-like protein